ncbi:hypothetical protein ABZ772_19750 [Streptomyces griseoincarnatus]
MSLLPAPAPEPCRICGRAGGAGRGQWERIPLRLVLGDDYADSDLRVYTKHKALSRGRRATASVTKLAAMLDVSESTVERANRRLGAPASDGVVELFTKRQTHRVTGTGRTAERWTRPLDRGERYVSAPVLAADTMRGILYRCYLLVRYTTLVEKRDLTLAEIGWVLRHRSGKRAGQAISDAHAGRLLRELARLGWISLDERAGYRGRHLITVHDHPLHPVEEDTPTADPGDGSGPDLGDGSLAYKEDQELNDPRNTQERGAFRRRRDDRKWVAGPVDNLPVASEAPDTFRSRPTRPAYTGPQLTLSPRVWAVLAPVHDLLPAVSPYLVRRIAREIGRQLDTGIWPDDIRDQLQRMRAWTPTEELTDPGRWLIGAVLPVRSRCGRTGCHWGYLAYTGTPCKACAEIDDARTRERLRTSRPPHTGPPPHTPDTRRPA